MNKIAIKAAAVCLSLSMCASAMLPAVSNVFETSNSTVVYAAESKVGKNLIENPECTSTKGFGLYLAGGADATLSAKDGALDVSISEVGTLNYGVQLNYPIIPLYKNGVYKLSFDIKSDVERYTEAMIQMDGGDYRSYVWTDCNVTTEWQTVEKKFTMEEDSDIAGKLCFNMGNQKKDADKDLGAHHFYVDNVKVEVVDDSQVDYSTFTAEETPILTNQLGYLPNATKIAVLRGEKAADKFSVVNADTKKEVYVSNISDAITNKSADETNYYADFSKVTEAGKYIIKWGDNESYPFEIGEKVYDDVLKESVYWLYTQRCGCEVKGDVVNHKACHTDKATVYKTDKKIDVSGGWHDAGDYGRYVVPAAKSVADLLLAYDTNKDLFADNTGIPESGNGVADILDEARYELEWMLKMQDTETGGAYHKVSCAQFPGFVMPEKETDELFVTPVSSTATADFCAAMAMAYTSYKSVDEAFANKCLDAAKAAWKWLEANPDYVFIDPVKDITTGDYADFKKKDKDERYWAAVEMLKATGDTKFEETIKSIGAQTGLGWSDMGTYGSISYLLMDESKQNAEIKSMVEKSLLSQAEDALEASKANPYGEALESYFWGCNMDVANMGILFTYADKIDSTKGFKQAAAEQINYLLGKNPLGNSFVTGFGTVASSHPHHRPSIALEKCVPGMVVGGPDSALEDNKAKAYLKDAAPAKCYVDDADSYSTNEVTIYWNSPFTTLLTQVLSADNAAVTEPTAEPTTEPTTEPTADPTATPTTEPTEEPTDKPTVEPTTEPTDKPTTEPTVMKGDIDGNGVVDITDVSLLSLYLIGDKKLSDTALKAADVDGDGDVRLTDAARMLQFLSKNITSFD
ncbi:glycoside hydrolase family 9 protein [Ruminococcus sp. HUN007]|uniref:glycoside hydrolase family 9 protein n=1 Tax=Ruminococcus sp. HUN007 TaxID=1514668 RepID=UPI000678B66D|nr:glycoside hydrolase family 9 protein [Ruminococcus sp. HUN007]